MNELIPLAAAIEAGNQPLRPHIDKLIQNAPESFVDPRAGEIAVTVRAMRHRSEPVNFQTIAQKHRAQASFISAELLNSALPEEEAEFHAAQCCKTYQIRRTQSIFADAYQDLITKPEATPSIIDAFRAALDEVTSNAKANGFTIRTPDEILDMVFNDDDIILGDRIIAEGQSCVVAAAGGSGKSRLLAQLAACVSTGRKFLNFETGRQSSNWLFLQTENSNRRLQDDFGRLKSWLGADWSQFASRVKFHTVENDTDSFVNLDSPDAVANLQSAIQQYKPDIVVIDPLNDFAIGDLNKDADMKSTVQTLSRICRKGNPKRAIVVLHHALTGKAGAIKVTGYDRASFGRNSKSLHAWTRAQINLAPVDTDSNDRLIIGCGKCSNGREFPTFAVRLNPDSMIYECDSSVDVTQWMEDVAGLKNTASQMNPDRVRELCDLAGSSKAELVKAIMEDCYCVRQSAYRYILRAESAKQIKFKKQDETYYRT